MEVKNTLVSSKCPFSKGKTILFTPKLAQREEVYFVEKHSIVRKIWGKSDTILFIFAGAAAEFSLNKAVDWLYFTGKLPSDPLARLFSTVEYARKIIFATKEEAENAIEIIRKIHESVEEKRGFPIPDWAYKDVLFMLIDYSILGYELLEQKLSPREKEEVFEVFYQLGTKMGIQNLPQNYTLWLSERDVYLENDLQKTELTLDLFQQYQKHLGKLRYKIMIEVQKLIVPKKVKKMLGFNRFSLLFYAIPLYKMGRKMKLDSMLKNGLLPKEYKTQINDLNVSTN